MKDYNSPSKVQVIKGGKITFVIISVFLALIPTGLQ